MTLNSSNNVAGNVLISVAMLVFLSVSVIVEPKEGFRIFWSWCVGVVLGLNLVNNIRLLSRVAKKKLVKGNRPLFSGKSLNLKVVCDALPEAYCLQMYLEPLRCRRQMTPLCTRSSTSALCLF